jgi:hypothetical protein
MAWEIRRETALCNVLLDRDLARRNVRSRIDSTKRRLVNGGDGVDISVSTSTP